MNLSETVEVETKGKTIQEVRERERNEVKVVKLEAEAISSFAKLWLETIDGKGPKLRHWAYLYGGQQLKLRRSFEGE